MRINPRKIRKILGRIWTAPKRIFETFCTQETPRCIGMNATLTTFIWFRKSNKDFSYTIFPVKKNKCWKNFKIMIKLLFNYSFYSHPEIGNFKVWQSALSTTDCPSLMLLELRFRDALSWGLFLGLVGLLWLRDLRKLMWESLVVNLGHRPSSSLHRRIFIGSHSLPPSLVT
jgi:hypothetical protein